jgi:hypothetical protein
MTELQNVRAKFRVWLILFIIALVLSGITAFGLVWELEILDSWFGQNTLMERIFPSMADWISRVHNGIAEIQIRQPYIYYGTDWLAFGHLVIAVAFLGPLKDPIRNRWVIDFGIIACILVIPLALVCGPIRGIPFFWQLIDCSFGVVGIVPLLICRSCIKKMEKLAKAECETYTSRAID